MLNEYKLVWLGRGLVGGGAGGVGFRNVIHMGQLYVTIACCSTEGTSLRPLSRVHIYLVLQATMGGTCSMHGKT